VDGHVGLIFLAERHVNVGLQAFAEHILLHAANDPNDLGIAAPFGFVTYEEPNVLADCIAAGPQTLGGELIEHNYGIRIRVLGFIPTETAAL
jgi:hypothetical protein